MIDRRLCDVIDLYLLHLPTCTHSAGKLGRVRRLVDIVDATHTRERAVHVKTDGLDRTVVQWCSRIDVIGQSHLALVQIFKRTHVIIQSTRPIREKF